MTSPMPSSILRAGTAWLCGDIRWCGITKPETGCFRTGTDAPLSKEVLLERLRSHIETVVGRYKGEIYAWDVVNEAVADEGGELLRPSKWLDIAGPGFISKAFEFAHEADPNARLFYNDYNESHPHKRDKIYALVKSLLEQGVPIHGIGLQAHWNIFDPSLDDIRAAIEKYASLGLELQLTELDVSVFRFDDLSGRIWRSPSPACWNGRPRCTKRCSGC